MEAVVTPRDRLSFTVFLAASLHAAVILGVGFAWNVQRAHSPTIEVTLAQHDDHVAPDKADFLAQSNQLGSGDAQEVRETTTTETANFHESTFQQVASDPEPQERRDAARALLTTQSAQEEQATTETPQDAVEPRLTAADQRRLLNLSDEIASIEARVDSETNTDAKSPRVRRLTSVSAREAVDAYYLQAWRRKVETVGNMNYPEEARRDQLYGSLRLMVAITPDGALKDVRVLDSSGFKVLDDAAIRIVRQAAPFAPFPEEMKRNTDVLEIIRTWQFRRNHYSSSS
ncbi:MAG TPA: energy transducer TonB [Pseudomonadales bacterium]|nr:energy transducer TonB [Pseudomonadales bacterium]